MSALFELSEKNLMNLGRVISYRPDFLNVRLWWLIVCLIDVVHVDSDGSVDVDGKRLLVSYQ